ncbi:MAG: hypothetical protein JJD92_12390 [Frankiaceae bacterium]|nr:hypothetical protein [Frankiaceae bacterium]
MTLITIDRTAVTGWGPLQAQLTQRLQEEHGRLRQARKDGDDLQTAISQAEIDELYAVARRNDLEVGVGTTVPMQDR